MRYREFDVSSLRALPGTMTPGLYKGHALPRIWRQYVSTIESARNRIARPGGRGEMSSDTRAREQGWG
jgi:hypothetical protein